MPYFSYSGPFQYVDGVVSYGVIDAAYTEVQYWIENIDPACQTNRDPSIPNSCGIHIHEGPSCSANALGHHYDPTQTTFDPWTDIHYAGTNDYNMFFMNGTLARVAGAQVVSTFLDHPDLVSRTFIVHDFTGNRIACGTVVDGIDSLDLIAEPFAPYPGYTGPLMVDGEVFAYDV